MRIEVPLLLIPDTFLNPSLLWGLPLAAVPLVLFLLERRRATVVDWPALRFFLKDVRKVVRWMRFTEVLLLLIRMALIAGVAYALARPASVAPLLTAERPRGAVGSVLLLDTSFSMGWRSRDGRGPSLWEAAQEEALQVIGRHRDGDAFWVVPLAGKREESLEESLAKPLRTLADARAAVRGLSLEGGGAKVLEGLDLAADLLAMVSVAKRDVYIFTDLQASSWSVKDASRWAFVLGRLRVLSPAPSVHVIVPGGLESSPGNRAIVSLEVRRPIVGTDRPAEIIARLGKFGGEGGPSNVKVLLTADGLPVASRVASASPGSLMEIRFSHRFETPGFHRVRVQMDGDGLASDDVRYLSLHVTDRIPVLIISGEGKGGRLGGEGDLVELALAPRAGEEVPPEVIFRPRTVSWKDVLDSGALEAFVSPARRAGRRRLVVLANVPYLDPRAVQMLERFVRGGGGLLVFLGSQVDLTLYNSLLYRDGNGFLPGSLTSWRSGGADRPVSPRGFRLSHPAFGPFSEKNRPDLEGIRIWRWMKLVPSPSGSVSLAALPSGSPFLVEKVLGRGKTLLVATSVDRGDSDISRRPLFVPLLHGFAYYLASGVEDPRNIPVGEEMELELSPEEVDETDDLHVSLEAPDGSLQALEVRRGESGEPAARVAAAARARRPGYYTFHVRAGDEERSVLFAANPSPEESDLSRLEEDERSRISEAFGFSIHGRARDIWKERGSGSRYREHWPWILSAVVLLAFLEIFLTRFLARGRAPSGSVQCSVFSVQD